MGETNVKDKKPIFRFSKEKILSSKRYQKDKDVLSAVLDENKMYSHKQVDDALKTFYEKEVR